METSRPTSVHRDSLADFLAGRAAFVLALMAVLYCTLHSFVFDWSRARSIGQIVGAFDPLPISSGGVRDLAGNVAMFMPLGFGLAGLTRRWGSRRSALVTVLGCGLLSTTVETLQVFLPSRDPAVGDVIANTIGSFIGFAAQRCCGAWVGSWLAWAIRTRRGAVSRRILLVGLLLYATAMAGVLYHYARRLRISSWNGTYWLLLGNEHTGDRPWRGKVTELSICSRMISEDSAEKLFEGAMITDLMPRQVTAEYDLQAWTDGFGHLPALRLKGTGAGSDTFGPTSLSELHWRESETPASNLAVAVNESSAITIVITAAASEPQQSGPARILSFSKSILERNLMVGQDGSNLVIRIRTPVTGGGGKPEFIVPGVFADRKPHRIVIAFDGRRLRVWVDSIAQRHGLDITPDMAMFWRLRPPGDREIRLDESIRHIPYLVFRACALLPAGLMMALLISACRNRLEFWVMMGIAVIAVPVLLEISLAMLSHQSIFTQRWFGSTIIMAALSVGLFWRSQKPGIEGN